MAPKRHRKNQPGSRTVALNRDGLQHHQQPGNLTSDPADPTMSTATESFPDRNTICRDFIRNVCRRESRCRFRHVLPDSEGPALTARKRSEPGIGAVPAAEGLLQGAIVFCHDFQNSSGGGSEHPGQGGRGCGRGDGCRFVHCSMDEEAEYRLSGYLPPHVRDQAIAKGLAPDLPALFGARPICKDFLRGQCKRSGGGGAQGSCKFRHVTPMQYDLEINGYIRARRLQSHHGKDQQQHHQQQQQQQRQLGVEDGLNYLDFETVPAEADFAGHGPLDHQPLRKRFRAGQDQEHHYLNKQQAPGPRPLFCSGVASTTAGTAAMCHQSQPQQLMPQQHQQQPQQQQQQQRHLPAATPGSGPAAAMLPPSVVEEAVNLLQQENVLLKQRVEELKKQVADLSTTNDFLLDQNAQLRLGVKSTATTVTTVVAAQPQQPPPISQAAAAAAVVAAAAAAAPQSAHPQGQAQPCSAAQGPPPGAPVVSISAITMSVPPPAISMACVQQGPATASRPMPTSIAMTQPQQRQQRQQQQQPQEQPQVPPQRPPAMSQQGSSSTTVTMTVQSMEPPQPISMTVQSMEPPQPISMAVAVPRCLPVVVPHPAPIACQPQQPPPPPQTSQQQQQQQPASAALQQPPPQLQVQVPNTVRVHETRLMTFPIASIQQQPM